MTNHSTKADKNKVCELATKINKKNKKNKHTYANQSIRYTISENNGCVGKSKKYTSCHEFTGSISTSGYGQTYLDGTNQTAHRVAYKHFIGEIPGGKEVGHICNNRCCINPDHLEAVTHSENIQQSYVDTSNRKPNVKLSKKDRLKVIQLKHLPRTELANMFDVSITTITRILAKNK